MPTDYWLVHAGSMGTADGEFRSAAVADGSAAFTKALGIELDLTSRGLGVRANRGVFTIENGVVTSVDMEAPGKLEVSTADACLLGLKK